MKKLSFRGLRDVPGSHSSFEALTAIGLEHRCWMKGGKEGHREYHLLRSSFKIKTKQ